jgi:hypothetical protein
MFDRREEAEKSLIDEDLYEAYEEGQDRYTSSII